jgi:hypothetical protein
MKQRCKREGKRQAGETDWWFATNQDERRMLLADSVGRESAGQESQCPSVDENAELSGHLQAKTSEAEELAGLAKKAWLS